MDVLGNGDRVVAEVSFVLIKCNFSIVSIYSCVMEINQYLLLLLTLFAVDTLVMPSLAKNEGESDLPKSPGMGEWWRSFTVSDLANEDGQTMMITDKSRSFTFLTGKVAFVGSLVYLYYTQTAKTSLKIVDVLGLVVIGLMSVKYIAYAGWFDDKQCSNFYISGLSSDRVEDVAYKVMYLIFGIVLAILIKVNPIRTNSLFTVLFLMGLPFVIYFIHWASVRLMYIGCQSSIFENECSISPATFYREYIFGQASEDHSTMSKSWDFLRRGLTVLFAFIISLIAMRDHILPSQRNLPTVFILLTGWFVFGIPLILNWLTTIDAERKAASDETNKVTVDETEVPRDYKGWRCVINKYGGISGYFLLLCIQLYILQGQLTS